MSDELTTPAGKALVRVIQASLKQQTIGVSWDGTVVVSKLAFDGGTAPHGPGSPLPWLVVIGAGSLLALTGGLRLRRLAR